MRLSGGTPIERAASGETPGAKIRTTMNPFSILKSTWEFTTTPSSGGQQGGSRRKVSPGSG